MIHMAQHTGV
ncbi:hypothetical protein F383_24654 [Gossypium arboreum]|uniref:Uncharacterized protein n=1 Tax=Gossypium arboreum TaxID=29729 RepID=A0A0B0MTA0_GOSAR|nr:hypothetical protein F383_24654 [Gossypium arboreum]